MALPFSRFYTYAAGQVVGGSPFMIAQHLAAAFFTKNRRKQQSLVLPVFSRQTGWSHTLGDAFVTAGGAGVKHRFPIHLPVGCTIPTAYLGYKKAGASSIRFSLYRQSHATGVAVEVVFVALTGAAGSWFYDPLTVGTVIQEGFSYWLEASAGQTGDVAQRAELVYTRG